MEYPYTIYIDAGHGGVDPETGKYTTAPSKMWNHGDNAVFHDGGKLYEGVSNRDYVNMTIKKLENLGIRVMRVYHPFKDTSLKDRVTYANWYHDNGYPGIYYSFHSNACGGCGGKGFAIYTSRGQTKSDSIAEDFYQRYKENFIENQTRRIKGRTDRTDGDHDKEANFYVLKYTKMPAVLFENLFFDTLSEAKLITNKEYMNEYTDIVIDNILWAMRNVRI